MEKKTSDSFLKNFKGSLERDIENGNITKVRKRLVSFLRLRPEDNCQIFINLINWADEKCVQKRVSLFEPFDEGELIHNIERQLNGSDIDKAIKALEQNFSRERAEDAYGVCIKVQVDEKLHGEKSSSRGDLNQKSKEKNKLVQIIDALINKFRAMMASASKGLNSFSDKVYKSTLYFEEKARDNPNKVLGFIMNIGSLFYKIILLPLRGVLKIAKSITWLLKNPKEVNKDDII